MTKRVRNRDRLLSRALFALILGAWIGSGPAVLGFGDPPTRPVQPKPKPKGVKGLLSHRENPTGTLGYGPPGPQPGFQGFGLRYGLNYGYGGGNALGVGADGGHPLFGGPGYPHPGPVLRRIGGITAFPYYGGTGSPSPEHPNFFGEPGTVTLDQPVIRFEDDPGGIASEGDFGQFTGMLPYPEKTFAPFSTESGNSASDSSSNGDPQTPPPPPPGAGEPSPPPPPPPPVASSGLSRSAPGTTDALSSIGIDAEPVADGGSTRGLKVTKVHPGKPAARSGLTTGDIIRSGNGYVTEQLGNLDWIVANAAPDKTLNLSVRTARDGEIRAVTTQLR